MIIIFNIALALLLIISGLLKIIYFNYTYNTIKKIDIFPSNSIYIVAISLPFFEIVQGLLLIFYVNIITYFMLIAYLLFFMIINIKSYIGKEIKECCCYGKFIKSKLGLGGFIHYTYWLIILFFTIFCYKYNIFVIQNILDFKVWIILIILILNGLLIRILLERVF
jgi:hypothetical protein